MLIGGRVGNPTVVGVLLVSLSKHQATFTHFHHGRRPHQSCPATTELAGCSPALDSLLPFPPPEFQPAHRRQEVPSARCVRRERRGRPGRVVGGPQRCPSIDGSKPNAIGWWFHGKLPTQLSKPNHQVCFRSDHLASLEPLSAF